MILPPFGDFAEVLATEARAHSALDIVLAHSALSAATDGPFFGKTAPEVAELVDAATTELTAWARLAVVVTSERMFFADAEQRVKLRAKRDVVRRALGERLENKQPTLGHLLDVWRPAVTKKKPFHAYSDLLKVRHWSAHGERWTLKTAFAGEAWDAWSVVEDLVVAIRADFPDFPIG